MSTQEVLDLFQLAVKCYNGFLQANWTGPLLDNLIFEIPEEYTRDADSALSVDGEQVYAGCEQKHLLVAAIRIFDHIAALSGVSDEVGLWRARVYFTWQRSLGDSNDRGQGHCPTLMNVCLNAYVDALLERDYITSDVATAVLSHLSHLPSDVNLFIPHASSLPAERQAEYILELVVRLAYYNKLQCLRPLMEVVSGLLGVSVEVTGVEGIRRQHQSVSFAQMTTLVSRSEKTDASAEAAPIPMSGAPKALNLADYDVTTDVFETVKFDNESMAPELVDQITSKLSPIEQCFLICEALCKYYSANSRDELNLETVHALAMRVISTCAEAPPCWISYSMCLLLRSRSEFFRNSTRGRACFQVDALVSQFSDAEPQASDRIAFLHCSGFPSLWELQRENGLRMMEVGMVVTACEMFKKLKMFPLALDCLAVAGRKQEAIDLLDTLRPLTPRLLCSQGDMTGDVSFYHQAWAESNGSCARAQRSIGRMALKNGKLEEAAHAFELSLAINPLFDDILYSLGSILLKLDRDEEAAQALVRCVSVNPEHIQAWVNLCAVYSRMGEAGELDNCFSEAKKAAEQAVKLAPHAWQYWENLELLCVRCEDWGGALRAERKLAVDLAAEGHPDEKIINLLLAKVENLKFLKNQIVSFLEDLVLKNKHSFGILHMLAQVYLQQGLSVESFKTQTFLLKEILASLQDPDNGHRKKNSLQEIIDTLVVCLKDVETLLSNNATLSSPGLSLTMRSLPRRVTAVNNNTELPLIAEVCDRIGKLVANRNRIDE